MEWLSTLIGAVGGGSVVGGAIKVLYDRRIVKADRKDSENLEARKAIIKLLPELSKAESRYASYLSDSIYLNDLEGDVHHGWVPTIASVSISETLVDMIASTPLHLLNGHALEVLSNHSSNLAILEHELSSMQSSHHYDYDDPGMIALNAKIHMERRLADLTLELHDTRKQLTLEFIGGKTWSDDNKRRRSELITLRHRAYGIKSSQDRFRKVRRWLSINRVRFRNRIKRRLRSSHN